MSTSPHDPSNRQRPAAPRKKSVYLRRRIIALAVLVAMVAILWSLVAAAVGFVQGVLGGTGTTPVGTGGSSAVEACATNSILLEPIVADAGGAAQASFDTGINPFFGYRVTNIGSEECSLDLGARDTYYRVTSGEETIWSSENCDRTGLVSSIVTLKPNEPRSNALSDWYRVKSSSTGCGAEQTPVTAGGASYHLSVEVGGMVSKETSQFILK